MTAKDPFPVQEAITVLLELENHHKSAPLERTTLRLACLFFSFRDRLWKKAQVAEVTCSKPSVITKSFIFIVKQPPDDCLEIRYSILSPISQPLLLSERCRTLKSNV